MAKRLIKVATELNVGLSTLVNHLVEAGYEVEERPSFKVSDEMYESLLVAFEKSIAIKEEADKLVLGNRNKEERKEENVKKEVTPEPKATIVEQPKPKDSVVEPELVTDEIKEESDTKEKKETHEEKVEKTTPEDSPKVEPKAESDTDESTEETPIEDKNKITGPKVLGKIDLSNVGKKKKSTKKPTKPSKDEPSEKEEAKQKSDSDPLDSEPKLTPEDSQQETQNEPSEAIDTNQTVEETAKAADPVAEISEVDSDTHKTKVPQLKGLKVLGKIDTDKLKKKPKKKVETKKSSDDNDPKKKRKRIRRKVAPKVERNKVSKPKQKKEEVKEISQKEIEEKIKATMARIGGGSKKKRQKLRREKRETKREQHEQQIAESNENVTIELTEFISVNELASLLGISVTEVITTCMNLGVIVSINQRLDAEIIELVAEEYDKEVSFISAEEQVDEDIEIEENEEDLEDRAPIVTVMGHVDHGKTSLLDYIRKADVAGGEAGGITQHIGAYEVRVGENKDKKITFLDTPGHEAFTAMRARGAKVTDIAVIIIAADDNIMPQTKEAISHAQAAGVPIIFAINKIDKPGANPDRIKGELAEMNLMVEEWGGKYQSQDISAKNGTNIDLLLEKILLEAEVLELKANPNRPAIATTLDASLDKGRGYVTKVLVQTGTLKIGDAMYAGEYSGKVKAMFNGHGKRVKKVGPSTPALILGLSGAPQSGEILKVSSSEQDARTIANKRAQILREQANRASKRISLDEIGRRLALGTFKELNLIIKGDVDGSVEALADSLIKLSVETIQVRVIHKAVGQIIESDVLLASASDAIIIGFQVRPSGNARKLAEKEGIEIKTYSIIYKAIEEIKLAMEGMLEPTKEENITGQIDVREVYKISKVGTIAGCYVQEGNVSRNNYIRLVRDGIVIYPTKEGQHGEIDSLKRFKDDVKDVRAGMECGISIKNFNDIKVGDVIECYEIVEVKQTLE